MEGGETRSITAALAVVALVETATVVVDCFTLGYSATSSLPSVFCNVGFCLWKNTLLNLDAWSPKVEADTRFESLFGRELNLGLNFN